MKYPILAFALALLFAVSGYSQTPPADADPVLLGSTSYKLPQAVIDAEIDGKVTIAIQVDKTGKPTKANVVAGPAWPCSSMPTKALDSLFSNLSEEMLKLRFSPAVKDGKVEEREIGLAFLLKNPKLDLKPVEIDLITGKPKARIINGGIINGKAISLPKPSYPEEAKFHRDSGMVEIQVVVDEQGKVIRAGAISGLPSLQAASREAACGARFSRTILEGHPVKVSGFLQYAFIP